MGRAYEAIDDKLAEFIRREHLFFVANKYGLDSFAGSVARKTYIGAIS